MLCWKSVVSFSPCDPCWSRGCAVEALRLAGANRSRVCLPRYRLGRLLSFVMMCEFPDVEEVVMCFNVNSLEVSWVAGCPTIKLQAATPASLTRENGAMTPHTFSWWKYSKGWMMTATIWGIRLKQLGQNFLLYAVGWHLNIGSSIWLCDSRCNLHEVYILSWSDAFLFFALGALDFNHLRFVGCIWQSSCTLHFVLGAYDMCTAVSVFYFFTTVFLVPVFFVCVENVHSM